MGHAVVAGVDAAPEADVNALVRNGATEHVLLARLPAAP
jgi:hypothetical protein